MVSNLNRVIYHAALSGAFDDPERFTYHVSAASERDSIISNLARQCDEVIQDDKIYWRMKTAPRSQTLRALRDQPELLRELWRKRSPLKRDLFAQALKKAITNPESLNVEQYSDKGLNDAIAAVTFAFLIVDPSRTKRLEDAEHQLYALAKARARAESREAVLPHQFFGRSAERECLVSLIETGEIGPPLKRLIESNDTREGPVRASRALVAGGPGMGKSAFLATMADLLRDVDHNKVVVRFDFDMYTLSRGGEAAWFEHLSREVGDQVPELHERLSEVRKKHQRLHLSDRGRSTSSTLAMGDYAALITEVADRVVILADTSEELVLQDRRNTFEREPDATQYYAFCNWIEELSGHCSQRIPFIFAGRTRPPFTPDRLAELFDASLMIGPLDTEAANKLLEARTKRRTNKLNEAQRQTCVKAVGGVPLHLILTEKFLNNLAPEDRDAQIEDLHRAGLSGVATDVITRTLYTRFLDRMRVRNLTPPLTEDDIKLLAHPGLLLRFVTPDMLRDILAPAVGLDLSADGLAEAAFEALRDQVWLVEPGPVHGSLRHQPDARRVMLPMMLQESSDQSTVARKVIDLTVAWFEARNDPESQAEAAFLRALSGDVEILVNNPDLVRRVEALAGSDDDRQYQDGIEDQAWAGDDLAAMPIHARALLKHHRGDRLTDEEIRHLPKQLAGEAVKQELRKTVSSGASLDEELLDLGREMGAVSGVDEDDLNWLPEKVSIRELLDDGRVDDEIDLAFHKADYAKTSWIGWSVLDRSDDLSELSDLFRAKMIPNGWPWKMALSSALEPPDPHILQKFEERTRQISGHRNKRRSAIRRDTSVIVDAFLRLSGLEREPEAEVSEAVLRILDSPVSFEALRCVVSSSAFANFIVNRPQDRHEIQIKFDLFGIPFLAPEIREGAKAGVFHLRGPSEEPNGLFSALLDADTTKDFGAHLIDLLERERSQSGSDAILICNIPVGGGSFSERQIIQGVLRGTTPELHETIRAGISRLPPEALLPAVERIRNSVDFWPSELSDAVSRLEKVSPTRAAPIHRMVIRFADLSGELPGFVEYLAEATLQPEFERTAALLKRLDTFWNYGDVLGRSS